MQTVHQECVPMTKSFTASVFHRRIGRGYFLTPNFLSDTDKYRKHYQLMNVHPIITKECLDDVDPAVF